MRVAATGKAGAMKIIGPQKAGPSTLQKVLNSNKHSLFDFSLFMV
jgi:hypothetical protein